MANTNIDIHLNFGDETDEKTLIDTHLLVQLGQKYVQEKRKHLGIKDEKNNDIHFIIKFHVPVGRQKQAVQYLQRGMDQPDREQKKYYNPIQRILTRPKSTGKVSFEEKPGLVCVHYIIYEEYTFQRIQEKRILQILNSLKKTNFTPKIQLKGFVKGEEGKSVKQRTQIQANYVDIQMKIKDICISSLRQALKEIQDIGDIYSKFLKSPILSMILFGAKKIKLNYDMIPLRKIVAFYKQAANIESLHNPDKYNVKDMIKDKIQIEGFVNNIGSVTGTISFVNEGIIQRFLKVIISVFGLDDVL